MNWAHKHDIRKLSGNDEQLNFFVSSETSCANQIEKKTKNAHHTFSQLNNAKNDCSNSEIKTSQPLGGFISR